MTDAPQTKLTPGTYVVVQDPGTEDERIVKRFVALDAALKWAQGAHHTNPVDVMRVLPDGSLTTEY